MSVQARPSRGRRRSAARLAAVQALYQLDLAAGTPQAIVEEFLKFRLGRDIEGVPAVEADREMFIDLVLGTTRRLEAIDTAVEGALEKGWSVPRLEAVLRAILRSGAYELVYRPDIDVAVSINEYVDIAGSFFSGREPAFVNGVLDRVARERRSHHGGDDGRSATTRG